MEGNYFYRDHYFETSWQLAVYKYCEFHGIDIEQGTDGIDFIINGKPTVIINKYTKVKREEGIYYIDEKSIKPILKFIYNKFGRNHLKKFVIKKKFKRRVIEFDDLTPEQFRKMKKRNVKYHYYCSECGKDEYTTWFLIDHFNDHLCRHCRKKLMKAGEYD